jgi:hypothetical protein
LVALYVGWLVGSTQLPEAFNIWAYLLYGLMTLGAPALTFFLLYAGFGGFDNRIIDGFVNLIAFFAGFFGIMTKNIQTGKVQTYIVLVVFAILILVFYISPF